MDSEQPILQVLSQLHQVETIARGQGIRELSDLVAKYGRRNWRKMKCVVLIEDEYGYVGDAEINWYEAHGVGKVRWKIKRRLQ